MIAECNSHGAAICVEYGDDCLYNISRLPTGCYIADATGFGWCHAFLLDENLNMLESSSASAYTVDSIYVGYEGYPHHA